MRALSGSRGRRTAAARSSSTAANPRFTAAQKREARGMAAGLKSTSV
jgi:hypothetical protein